MATLHCQHCQAGIDSDARHTQCRQCGALFPFRCAVCERKLRGPFPIFGDERYLTLVEENLEPLCADHFLRHCPDCENWFRADENAGFFRCAGCSQKAVSEPATPIYDESERFEDDSESLEENETRATPLVLGRYPDFNTLVLAGAGCAFVALVSWCLLAR